MRACEWFVQVRSAVLRYEAERDRVREAQAALTLKAQTYTEGRAAGYQQGDGIDALLDAKDRLDAMGREVDAMVGEVRHVLYGTRGRSGVAKLKGQRYADALWLRYANAMTWAEVAGEMGAGKRWCQMLCKAALDYIDRVGWAAIESADEVEEDWVRRHER